GADGGNPARRRVDDARHDRQRPALRRGRPAIGDTFRGHLPGTPPMTRLRAGLVLLGALALVAAFAGVAGDPYRITLDAQLPLPPSPDPLLGTDHAGRDTLARLIHGTRVSLGIGISAALVQVSIGLALGAAAGFFGGL